jgi:hypothetical protein
MHQPTKLTDPTNSRAATRGRGLRTQQRTSFASKPASSKSTTFDANHPPQPQVRQLHSRASVPIWLKSLVVAQKFSLILFVSVFGLSSIVYGYTMHTQTTWRNQQDRLRRWQNQERHQGVMNENLKQDLAKTAAAKGSGLVDPKPQMVVFIHGAPPRQPKSLPAAAQASKPMPASKIPSGY